jgi:hypothetical protein
MATKVQTRSNPMPKKKPPKATKKVPAAPPPKIEEGDTGPATQVNQSIESDASPVARRSIEADNENMGGDVERLDE